VEKLQFMIRHSVQTAIRKNILKEEIESKCLLCKEYEETVDYLTSGCSTLLKNEYIIRHDKMFKHIH